VPVCLVPICTVAAAQPICVSLPWHAAATRAAAPEGHGPRSPVGVLWGTVPIVLSPYYLGYPAYLCCDLQHQLAAFTPPHPAHSHCQPALTCSPLNNYTWHTRCSQPSTQPPACPCDHRCPAPDQWNTFCSWRMPQHLRALSACATSAAMVSCLQPVPSAPPSQPPCVASAGGEDTQDTRSKQAKGPSAVVQSLVSAKCYIQTGTIAQYAQLQAG
jgi:hypothetical protein